MVNFFTILTIILFGIILCLIIGNMQVNKWNGKKNFKTSCGDEPVTTADQF